MNQELSNKLDALRGELLKLDTALEQRLPDHAMQLAKVNKLLLGQPELGGVMLDTDIGLLMRSIIADAGVQFSIGSKGKGATKKLSMDELDNLEL